MPEEQVEDLEFTCPQCGSHHFGSGLPENIAMPDARDPEFADFWNRYAEGACHGYTRTGACRFTWARRDDSKYFKGTGRFRARTVMTGKR